MDGAEAGSIPPWKIVAYQLGLSEGSVKIYAATIYRKLGIDGRKENAALWAMQHRQIFDPQLPAATATGL